MNREIRNPCDVNSVPCEVCNQILTRHEYLLTKDKNYTVCRAFDCRMVMSKKATMTPFLFQSHLEFNQKLLRERRNRNEIRKKHIESVTARESREHRAIFQSVLAKNPDLSEENTRWLVIPSGKPRSALVSMRRLKRYKKHIQSVVEEASRYANTSEITRDQHRGAYQKRLEVDQMLDRNPGLRKVSDKLCALCRGGCCVSGGDHAYHSVYSMRRYMDDHPEQSAREIIDLYNSWISPVTIEGSCINHTSTGCALPRYLRSDICNSFYCNSLKSYQQKMAGNKNPGTVLAIQRSSTYWVRFEPGVRNDITGVTLVETKTSPSKPGLTQLSSNELEEEAITCRRSTARLCQPLDYR